VQAMWPLVWLCFFTRTENEALRAWHDKGSACGAQEAASVSESKKPAALPEALAWVATLWRPSQCEGQSEGGGGQQQHSRCMRELEQGASPGLLSADDTSLVQAASQSGVNHGQCEDGECSRDYYSMSASMASDGSSDEGDEGWGMVWDSDQETAASEEIAWPLIEDLDIEMVQNADHEADALDRSTHGRSQCASPPQLYPDLFSLWRLTLAVLSVSGK
jgi:hypothetical protein